MKSCVQDQEQPGVVTCAGGQSSLQQATAQLNTSSTWTQHNTWPLTQNKLSESDDALLYYCTSSLCVYSRLDRVHTYLHQETLWHLQQHSNNSSFYWELVMEIIIIACIMKCMTVILIANSYKRALILTSGFKTFSRLKSPNLSVDFGPYLT